MTLNAVTSSGATSSRLPSAPKVAIDLEALVTWAIRDQRAHRDSIALHEVEAAFDDTRYEPRGASRDGVATMVRRGDIGCVIDGGGPARGIAPRVHPDAEAVASAILRVGDRRRVSLIHQFGGVGSRPDWLPYRQRLVAVEVPDNRPGRFRHAIDGEWDPYPSKSEVAAAMMARGERLRDDQSRSRIEADEREFVFRRTEDGLRREVLSLWCPVEPSPTIAEIRNVNEVWCEWWNGMAKLLGLLNRLTRFEVTGFAAPETPWGDARCRSRETTY